jgi:hypothetical protein
LLAAVVSLTGLLPASARQPELVSANVAEVGKGYRVVNYYNSKVLNENSEQVATIFDFVIGRDYALFAILDVGSFLTRLAAGGRAGQDFGVQRGKP